jgi:lysozyme
MTLQMSPQGRAALTEAFEGFSRVVYRDVVGVLTWLFGHTNAAGPPTIRPGDRADRAYGDEVLAKDLARVEAQVAAAVHVTLLQPQIDAVVDFAFNVGIGNLRSSTLLRQLNAGNFAAAADSFLSWNRAGGAVIAGLTRRRQAERSWFLDETRGEPSWTAEASLAQAHAVDHPDHPLVQVYNRARLALRGTSKANS